MIIEVKPIEVSHESILALHLHEQYLMQEFERIVSTDNDGMKMGSSLNNKETVKALEFVKQKMKSCEEDKAIFRETFCRQYRFKSLKISILTQ